MITCDVCDSASFEENDGFLFCKSCCTQSQKFVDMEVEADGHKVNKTILKDQTKKEILELTSWEEYNYILVGLVNQLIELGAKEEVKLTTLQLWADYLRKSEAAFFSKKECELPRLPLAYKEKDAILMYNKAAKTSRGKKSRRKANANANSAKSRRNRQKQIIESDYKTTTCSTWGSSSNQSIPINFTKKARRSLKKIMPKQHIKVHAESITKPKCHKIIIKDIPEFKDQHLGPRIIVSLLYIALNHINDKIQLGDMLRWIREGHLSMMNIERFFPEKYTFSAQMVEQMCQAAVVPHHRFRYHILSVMQLMKIEKLNRPDFTQLCRRYITELGLPDAVFKYAERLIRLNPPIMKMPQSFNTTYIPNYEGRAMAYIVFIIKLIFGLDGTTEELLSDSAEKVNCKIGKQKLFNFRKWMHFIDLRKTILTEYHFPIKLSTSTTLENNSHQFINYLNSIQTPETLRNNVGNRLKPLFEAMLKVVDIHQVSVDNKIKKSFKFNPSLTPNSDYLYQLNKQSIIDITKLLNENSQHSEFDVYLKKNALHRDLREKYGISLKFRKINRNIINMNKNLSKHIIQRGNEEILRQYSSKNRKGFIEVISKRRKLTNLERSIENEIKIALNRVRSPRMKKIEADANLVVEHAKILVNENNAAFEYEPIEGNLTDSETGQSAETSDSETEPELIFENIRQKNDERDLELNLRMFDNQSEDELSDNDWNDVEEEIEFFLPHFHYWRRICYSHKNFGERYENVERELPNSFNWFMRECARIIENKPCDLYTELLTIEAGFISLMKPLRKNTTRLKFRNWSKTDISLSPVLKYYDCLRRNW